jgi:hypothetical protein
MRLQGIGPVKVQFKVNKKPSVEEGFKNVLIE